MSLQLGNHQMHGQYQPSGQVAFLVVGSLKLVPSRVHMIQFSLIIANISLVFYFEFSNSDCYITSKFNFNMCIFKQLCNMKQFLYACLRTKFPFLWISFLRFFCNRENDDHRTLIVNVVQLVMESFTQRSDVKGFERSMQFFKNKNGCGRTKFVIMIDFCLAWSWYHLNFLISQNSVLVCFLLNVSLSVGHCIIMN